MAIVDEIGATYRGPRVVMRRLLQGEQHEARALAYLLAGLIVAYIAQWPAHSRAALLQPDVPMTQRMVAAFLGVMALIPVFYLVAAISRLFFQLFGGKGSYFAARVALFWAFLAVTPLLLLRGMTAGFLGAGMAGLACDLLTLVVFLWFWAAGLVEAEFGETQ